MASVFLIEGVLDFLESAAEAFLQEVGRICPCCFGSSFATADADVPTCGPRVFGGDKLRHRAAEAQKGPEGGVGSGGLRGAN